MFLLIFAKVYFAHCSASKLALGSHSWLVGCYQNVTSNAKNNVVIQLAPVSGVDVVLQEKNAVRYVGMYFVYQIE